MILSLLVLEYIGKITHRCYWQIISFVYHLVIHKFGVQTIPAHCSQVEALENEDHAN